ncbi:Calcineurin B-like protein 1 [Dendrobium catenatum]|uniref:Calcineurin B-like protein 1 n=1 Tax=Dendrobium catenatum TaxID=906689 RepID=A0A2I0X1V8_9ASPA|nr:Calcineurin B-like protein 1 [Dendrobium catenatum]
MRGWFRLAGGGFCVLELAAMKSVAQIFELFDVKQKGVIDFVDFVLSLNVKQMLIALLSESDMKLSDETVELILDKVGDVFD